MTSTLLNVFRAREHSRFGLHLLALAELLCASVLILVAVHGESFVLPWMIVGVLVTAYIAAVLVVEHRGGGESLAVPVWNAVLLVAALGTFAFLWFAHRRYLVVVALAQLVILLQRFPRLRSADGIAIVMIGLCGEWGLSAGLPYTSLHDLLLDATPANALEAFAFCAGLALVTLEVVTPAAGRTRLVPWRQWSGYAAAAGVFLLMGLRTDALYAEWTPYHRSYFVAPADFVRAGHWLLWDVPSQYGFLSILTIAVTPVRSMWQATYVDIALALTAEALMLFALLRAGRRGAVNYALAVAIPLAVLFSSEAARWPFGARLYPQQSLRFIWPLATLFIAFYLSRRPGKMARVRALWAAGFAAWGLGLLWSFETALWTSLVWVSFVLVDTTVDLVERRLSPAGGIARLLPLAGVPLALFGAIEEVYTACLGRGPDWVSFVEFSALYASGSPGLAFGVKPAGAGWLVLLILAAIGAIAAAAITARRFRVLPILAATFGAAWGTSVYYAGEPFDVHVNMILEIFAFATAIALYVVRSEKLQGTPILLARLAFVPMLVIVLTTTFGEPARIAAIRAPFTPGYMPDVTQAAPRIEGDLAGILRDAHVRPGDDVLLPNVPAWSKAEAGQVLPFVRAADGSTREVHSWLPVSPLGAYNTLYTLGFERRQRYIERFLSMGSHGGWYITYHESPDCSFLSPRLVTVTTLRRGDFAAGQCVLTTRVHRPEPIRVRQRAGGLRQAPH